VLAGAYVTDRIRRDVIVVHHGAWYDPVQTKKGIVDIHGNSNTLTMDVPTSSLACGNIASSGLVQVQKYTGELPALHVYDQPRTVRG
jgi:trimethylamine-N-oxide reductase (cytochrome c)